MICKMKDYLYAIKVRLVGNPLRDLNCYVICTPARNLLIDTGFNQPECLEDLLQGIEELRLDMSRTDILLTHLHADHSGLVDKIVRPGCKVYMGEYDKELLEETQKSSAGWQERTVLYRQEGFPVEILEEAARINPAKALVAEKAVPLTPLKNGQRLTIGEIQLTCIHTPGHTPGHICMYNERDKFMILGDHVLFDITPNITAWPSLPNTLGEYLQSLDLIRGYDVELPLPAHRECHCRLPERIEQLKLHHQKRLAETLRIVQANPGITAYSVAANMTWSLRGLTWDDFPLAQKWFAMGETLSHIYYLLDDGSLTRDSHQDGFCYSASAPEID